MKNRKDSTRPTVILNKTNSDGFLDFNSPSDLSEVMKVLKKSKDEGDNDE
ncbi:hypothetical protein [Methanobrevibacter sp.]